MNAGPNDAWSSKCLPRRSSSSRLSPPGRRALRCALPPVPLRAPRRLTSPLAATLRHRRCQSPCRRLDPQPELIQPLRLPDDEQDDQEAEEHLAEEVKVL